MEDFEMDVNVFVVISGCRSAREIELVCTTREEADQFVLLQHTLDSSVTDGSYYYVEEHNVSNNGGGNLDRVIKTGWSFEVVCNYEFINSCMTEKEYVTTINTQSLEPKKLWYSEGTYEIVSFVSKEHAYKLAEEFLQEYKRKHMYD